MAISASCQTISYVGVYGADGKYRPVSDNSRWHNQEMGLPGDDGSRQMDVPASVNLHPLEQTVENFQPPMRAVSPKPPSRWAHLRDDIITLAYGHQRMLVSPKRVITDSSGRVIVSDPAGSAVHVLADGESFRILTGANRRVVKASGVAVDGNDNIYIADFERGVIAVYDPDGRFLRYIGQLAPDETLFHYPTGIAIDSRTSRLYVLDAGRQALFILNLNGKLLRRVGRYTTNDKVVDFEYPSEIDIGGHELAILDAAGSRIWITDLDGNPLSHFNIAMHDRPEMVDSTGIAFGSNGNVYVSHTPDGLIRVYNRAGQLLNSLGHRGDSTGEFRVATGLCIDPQNRLYVADEYMHRVQVFQLHTHGQVVVAQGE